MIDKYTESAIQDKINAGINKRDHLIIQLAATIAPGLSDHLLSDDNFIDALHNSVADYVSSTGMFADEVEIDIAMELVQRINVSQD